VDDRSKSANPKDSRVEAAFRGGEKTTFRIDRDLHIGFALYDRAERDGELGTPIQ
jgi:hypothetical protein